MSLTAWRITKSRYVEDAFSGEGARFHGGRWNSVGYALVYAAGVASLAMLELLVHLGSSRGLANYVVIPCYFDGRLVARLDAHKLHPNWASSPPLVDVQRIGDEWVRDARSAVLRLPSALLPIEGNYLINPQHPDFAKIRIGDPKPLAVGPRPFQ